MRKRLALVLSALLLLSACGRGDGETEKTGETVELMVFAASSLTETLTEIGQLYHWTAPHVALVFSFGSSGDLARQIREGAECDVFLSASPRQMDALDGALRGDPERNPAGLNLLMDGSRVDLLENRMVLAVPEGNPGRVESFDDLAERLRSGNVFLALGGSGVAAGEYARSIFDYYNLNEAAAASCLTYGSSAKEVTALVEEAAVDCGILFATDAFSARLDAVDEAAPELCGPVLYSAAVLSDSAHRADALEFLDYLSGEDASAVFAWAGFTRPDAGDAS